jgi:hypothetical protein
MSSLNGIRAAVGALLGIVLLLVPAGDVAVAQTTGPTLAKCTCHFDDKDPPATDGATAVNATLCVQMLDKGHKWCEITVACLRNNVGPQCGAGAAPQSALLPLYAFAVAQVTQSGGPALEFMAPNFKSNQDALVKVAAANEKALRSCIESYSRRSSEDQRILGEQFFCTFDHSTGWLAIAFNFGPQTVQFSFGPRE